jgi:hypothetical protein
LSSTVLRCPVLMLKSGSYIANDLHLYSEIVLIVLVIITRCTSLNFKA